MHGFGHRLARRAPAWLARVAGVVGASWNAWALHRAASKGAALAFYTLFSITPILLIAVAVAGSFLGERAAQGEIVGELEELVGPNGAQAIRALLAAARNRGSGIFTTVVASVLLAIAATTVFVELKASLDELWAVEEPRPATPPRSGLRVLLRTRLVAFGLVLVLALLLLLTLVVSAALSVITQRTSALGATPALLLQSVSSLVSFAVIACLFAVIYKMLPDAPLSWNDVWIGSIVTALLFTVGKYAIGLYLVRSAVASSFGAAGSLVALLLWIYYSAQLFFFGAEFTRHFALRFGSLRRLRGQRAAAMCDNEQMLRT